MTLTEDLQEIDGVGEKTAEKVVEVVEDRDTSEFDEEAFLEGMEYYRAGRPGYAEKFFEQVAAGLDE